MAMEMSANAGTAETPACKSASRRPAEVCAELKLSDTARGLLEGDPSPTEYLSALLQNQCHADGVKYLAHALPKPEAVMWACQCVRLAVGEVLETAAARALAAAEAWARAPGAASCNAASAAAADPIPDDRGARFAALAASWSGESLAPEGLPRVPPPHALTGQGVAAAVMIAATSGAPDRIEDAYRNFIARGILIARTDEGIVGL